MIAVGSNVRFNRSRLADKIDRRLFGLSGDLTKIDTLTLADQVAWLTLHMAWLIRDDSVGDYDELCDQVDRTITRVRRELCRR